MRLDKYLAQASGASRSESRKLIRGGRVRIGETVVKSAAANVVDDQQVTLDGQLLELPEYQYLMLYKPPGTVCATTDAEHPTVIDLLPDEVLFNPKGELHPAGRLDMDTTGLVLITDDGQWSHNVTSPRKQCKKRYRVSLAEALDEEMVKQIQQRFAEGLLLKGEDKPTLPAQLWVETPTEVLIEISEGRYHQVKRMFAAVANRVVALHREQVGAIELDDELEPGESRPLSQLEIDQFC